MISKFEKLHFWILIFSFTLIYVYSDIINGVFYGFIKSYLYGFDFLIYILWLIIIAIFGIPISIIDIIKSNKRKKIRSIKVKIKKEKELQSKEDIFGYKRINTILTNSKRGF